MELLGEVNELSLSPDPYFLFSLFSDPYFQSKWVWNKQIVVVLLGAIVPNGFTNYTMQITPEKDGLYYDTEIVWFTGGSASVDKYMIFINKYPYMNWKIEIPHTGYQNARFFGGVFRYATVYSYGY